jgi:CheY-like chemotaxis protein
MVSAARSSEVAGRALAAGAERYLTKETPALQLLDAILSPNQSATAFEPKVA